MIIHDLINEFCISYSAFVPWTRAEGELLSKSKASWPFLAFGFWLLFCEGSCCILLGSALCGAQGCTERYKRERERNMWNMWMQFWRTHGNVWKCRLCLVCCVLSCVSWSPVPNAIHAGCKCKSFSQWKVFLRKYRCCAMPLFRRSGLGGAIAEWVLQRTEFASSAALQLALLCTTVPGAVMLLRTNFHHRISWLPWLHMLKAV